MYRFFHRRKMYSNQLVTIFTFNVLKCQKLYKKVRGHHQLTRTTPSTSITGGLWHLVRSPGPSASSLSAVSRGTWACARRCCGTSPTCSFAPSAPPSLPGAWPGPRPPSSPPPATPPAPRRSTSAAAPAAGRCALRSCSPAPPKTQVRQSKGLPESLSVGCCQLK